MTSSSRLQGTVLRVAIIDAEHRKDMPMRPENPYPPSSAEARFWADWARAFSRQPLPLQLASVESSLRHVQGRLRCLRDQLADGALKDEFAPLLVQLEAEANLLEEMGEHAMTGVVNAPARSPNGSGRSDL
jgi:hypothetical protein